MASADKLQSPDRITRAREIWFLALRTLSIGLFIIYLLWNFFWWLQGDFAPSLMIGLFGLPGPTTGFTRSIQAALHGHWRLSWAYHPFSIPFALLLIATIAMLVFQILRRRTLRLPAWMAWAWGVIILAGWLVKLLGNPRYW